MILFYPEMLSPVPEAWFCTHTEKLLYYSPLLSQ